MIFYILGWFLLGTAAEALSIKETVENIARQVANPSPFLAQLEILGPASWQDAKVILLPEVHDDSLTLLNQLLIIAQEKKRGGRLIFLGESIPAFNKSAWELFSQKTLNIATAEFFNERYSPQRFEKELSKVAAQLKSSPGHLLRPPSTGLWTLSVFANQPTILYGWDLDKSPSLTERNIQLAKSIQSALSNHDRVVVTLGARHVPELEYLSSLKILCPGHKIKNIEDFYTRIRKKYGLKPELIHGIGATAPLYDFLSHYNYAVIFNKNLYPKLHKAVHTPICVDIDL